jgi:hypothetical protein
VDVANQSRRQPGGPRVEHMAGSTALWHALIGAVCLAALPRRAAPHNWMHNPPGRAGGRAATSIPTRPSVRAPSMQVGAGQDFALQWMSGHPGEPYYFVMLHADDEAKLAEHSTEMLEVRDSSHHCSSRAARGVLRFRRGAHESPPLRTTSTRVAPHSPSFPAARGVPRGGGRRRARAVRGRGRLRALPRELLGELPGEHERL